MTTKRIGSYEILEDKVLGTGSDGVVYLGTCTKTGERVAVKKIDRTLLSHRAREHLAIEIRVLRALNHSNIVQLKDVIYEELGRDIYMVLEYVPGQDLFEYVQSRETPLAQAEAMQIMAQAVSAVGYCHARGIVHHDLCLENMMVRMEANAPLVSSRTKATGSPRIQLIDFGFCEEVQPGKLLERFSGSEPYAAPELFEGDAYEGLPIDVWSLGVILYVLMRGKFPFDPSDMDLHYDQATDPDYLSALLSDFDKNPAEAQVLDLLRRMLDPNPRTRISMPEVQNHAWFDSLSLNSNNTPALTNNNLLEISMRDDLKLGVSDFVSSVLLSNADAVVVSSMDLLRIEADVDRNGNVAGIQAGNEPVLIARVRTYTEAS